MNKRGKSQIEKISIKQTKSSISPQRGGEVLWKQETKVNMLILVSGDVKFYLNKKLDIRRKLL